MLPIYEKEIPKEIIGDYFPVDGEGYECIEEWEGPLLFTFKNPNGDFFIAKWASMNKEPRIWRWLVVPTTPQKVEELKADKVYFYDFLVSSTSEPFIVDQDNFGRIVQVFQVSWEDVDEKYLPKKNFFLLLQECCEDDDEDDDEDEDGDLNV